MGLRAGLGGCGKSRPHRDLIPGPSSPLQVAIPTALSQPTCMVSGTFKFIQYTYKHFPKCAVKCVLPCTVTLDAKLRSCLLKGECHACSVSLSDIYSSSAVKPKLPRTHVCRRFFLCFGTWNAY